MEEEHKPLSSDQEQHLAELFFGIFQDGRAFAEARSEAVADQFINLEVQIATILIAFASLFVGNFGKGQVLDILWAKFAFAIALGLLILSLIIGLLHLKVIERFCDGFLEQRNNRFNAWKKVLMRKTSYTEALAFEEGSAKQGVGSIIRQPRWPWILQTVFLGLGIAILYQLFIAFLIMSS
jgi:hypothetical protein